jgi:hypothetical protein
MAEAPRTLNFRSESYKVNWIKCDEFSDITSVCAQADFCFIPEYGVFNAFDGFLWFPFITRTGDSCTGEKYRGSRIATSYEFLQVTWKSENFR